MAALIQRIERLYLRNLDQETVSDELLLAVRNAIGDAQSALDWVATALDHQPYGRKRDRSPYFPLTGSLASFNAACAKDFPTLPQHVRDALERHQPYQPGKAVLGYLHDLGRINKHQDFTDQVRTVDERLERGGLSFSADALGDGRIQINGPVFTSDGRQLHPQTLQPLHGGPPVFQEVHHVGWWFAPKPPGLPQVPVVDTLQTLNRLVGAAVTDIGHAAGL